MIGLLADSENGDWMVKAEHAEMFIKGKNMIDAVGVDKGKAGAVSKAQAWEVIFAKDSSCGSFGLFCYSQYIYAASLISIHERKGGMPRVSWYGKRAKCRHNGKHLQRYC